VPRGPSQIAAKSNQATSSARQRVAMGRPSTVISPLGSPAWPAIAVQVERGPLELAQPVVLAAVHVHELGVPLEQCDCRQEALALQPVSIELGRRLVRSADQCHVALDQCVEQPGQDHRVGDVADEQLVQALHATVAGDGVGDVSQRIFAIAQSPQTRMDVTHEVVEVFPARRDADVDVKQVHQESLAAADPAPEVHATGRQGRAASAGQPAAQPAARWRLMQPLPHALERGNRTQLGRVRRVTALTQRVPIRGVEVHGARHRDEQAAVVRLARKGGREYGGGILELRAD
jgi:hypothetical protein